jgi:hypothetical protein
MKGWARKNIRSSMDYQTSSTKNKRLGVLTAQSWLKLSREHALSSHLTRAAFHLRSNSKGILSPLGIAVARALWPVKLKLRLVALEQFLLVVEGTN